MADDALAKMRELERMEELEALDLLVDDYERRADSHDSQIESHEAAMPSSHTFPHDGDVNSPADIFRLMSCVDDAAGETYHSRQKAPAQSYLSTSTSFSSPTWAT